jgi:hypothetical protein
MGQVVEVDAKSNYQCNITRNALTQSSCDKALNISISMSCTPGALFPVLDLPRPGDPWGVDHVLIESKCDINAINNSYIQFTADAYGGLGGENRNQVFNVPKNIGSINSWVTTVGGQQGFLVVNTYPNWVNGTVWTVPVYILPDSGGCQPNSYSCSYHFYWERIYRSGGGQVCDKWGNCSNTPVTWRVAESNSGWATSVMGQVNITDNWDNQCATLEQRS